MRPSRTKASAAAGWVSPSRSRAVTSARPDPGPAPRGGGVQRGRRDLGGDGAPGRAEQAQVQAVHEEDFERHVQHVRGDRDPQRRAGVGQPDEMAVPRVRHVQERQPRGGCPQVADRAGEHELVPRRPAARRGGPRSTAPPRSWPPQPPSRPPRPPGRPRRPNARRGRSPGLPPARPPPRSSRWSRRWPPRPSWSARWPRWPARRAAPGPGDRRWRCPPGCTRARRRSTRAQAARASRCAGPVPGQAGSAGRRWP